MKAIRVAASPARVAAKTQPILSGEHLARRLPMPWSDDRGSARPVVIVGLVALVPVVLLIVGVMTYL